MFAKLATNLFVNDKKLSQANQMSWLEAIL
jgi:hypothetical protein